ncbi:MAG: serine/threonine protein kinase [Pirellulales bacterium]|nr:serine/threonine protein kinase [Pirellulales bacterium]
MQTVRLHTTDKLNDTIDHATSGTGGHVRLSGEAWYGEADRSSSGRFRKLRPHDAGGMGAVWIALDLQLQREVALKELQLRHHGHKSKVDRFLVEGQITGALEHPGVVPVHALGIDENQSPYYAMRLIRGETLRAAIKAFHDDLSSECQMARYDSRFRELLRRFIDVCDTVAYAHSRGVLHRDLKPDNIMLGEFGETYVVDWGLARALGAATDDYSFITGEAVRPVWSDPASATQLGVALGTPGFMSPEQVDGRLAELTPATDVYSLGAILYYILSNQPPVVGSSFLDFKSRVCKGDFPPATKINPRASRALAAIAAKALATSPEERYRSARDLAADIDRWLADEPVSASPPRPIERAARWARKNRTWFLAGTAALVLVSAVSTIAALAVNRAREKQQELAVSNLALAESEAAARAKADERFLKARETVDTWLSGFSEALQSIPVAGVQSVRIRMLELAAEEYEAFAAEKSDDASLRLEQGRTLARLGSIYRMLGRSADAAARLAESGELLAAMENDPTVGHEAVVARAQALGIAYLVHADQGRAADADASFEAAIAALSNGGPDQIPDIDEQAALATLWTNRGGVLAQAGQYAAAQEAFGRALGLSESLVRLAPQDLSYRSAAATARIGAAQVQLALGDAAGASRNLELAAGFFDAATQLTELDASYLRLVVTANSHLAAAKRRLGDLAGERTAYDRAADAGAQLVRMQPDVPAFRVNLAMIKTDLGQLLMEEFDFAAAEAPLRDTVEIMTPLVDEYPSIPEYREVLAVALDTLAQSLLTAGRAELAATAADQATAELEALVRAFPEVAPYRQRLVVASSTSAQVRWATSDFKGASERFQYAVNELELLLASPDPAVESLRIAAVLRLRRGEMRADSNEAGANEDFAAAAAAWSQLLERSQDPEFCHGAAWFFAVCPAKVHRDPARACDLAGIAVAEAPFNIRYQLTAAVAQAVARRPEAARRTLDNPILSQSPIAPARGFVEAIAAANETNDSVRAAGRMSWDAADAWLATSFPGNRDLRALSRLSASRLEESTTNPSSP